jgi:hypothetical protein
MMQRTRPQSITKHPYQGRLKMFHHLFRASSLDLTNPDVHAALALRTVHPTAVQIDREVIALDAAADITIASLPKALRCIVYQAVEEFATGTLKSSWVCYS